MSCLDCFLGGKGIGVTNSNLSRDISDKINELGMHLRRRSLSKQGGGRGVKSWPENIQNPTKKIRSITKLSLGNKDLFR